MNAKKRKCPSCRLWVPDGWGGWGICKCLLAAQDVRSWRYGEEMTFEMFGCVYHQAKKAKKKIKKIKKIESKKWKA